MKRWSICFSNPPYTNLRNAKKCFESQNYDLILLDNAFQLADHVVFVITSRLVIRKDMQEYRNKFSPYCQCIEIFDGNEMFDIKIPFPLMIITLNKNKTSNTIKVVDDFVNEQYQISHLNNYNRYQFTQEEVKWWKQFIATPVKDSYEDHCIGWREFEAPLGLYLNRASSTRSTIIQDIVTEAAHIFKNKNEIMKKMQNGFIPSYNKSWHIVPIQTEQEGIDILNSYREEIIRAIINQTKHAHRINTKTTVTLPWPCDETGKVRYLTNEDWIKKLNMPRSVADKILAYYRKRPDILIPKDIRKHNLKQRSWFKTRQMNDNLRLN